MKLFAKKRAALLSLGLFMALVPCTAYLYSLIDPVGMALYTPFASHKVWCLEIVIDQLAKARPINSKDLMRLFTTIDRVSSSRPDGVFREIYNNIDSSPGDLRATIFSIYLLSRNYEKSGDVKLYVNALHGGLSVECDFYRQLLIAQPHKYTIEQVLQHGSSFNKLISYRLLQYVDEPGEYSKNDINTFLGRGMALYNQEEKIAAIIASGEIRRHGLLDKKNYDMLLAGLNMERPIQLASLYALGLSMHTGDVDHIFDFMDRHIRKGNLSTLNSCISIIIKCISMLPKNKERSELVRVIHDRIQSTDVEIKMNYNSILLIFPKG